MGLPEYLECGREGNGERDMPFSFCLEDPEGLDKDFGDLGLHLFPDPVSLIKIEAEPALFSAFLAQTEFAAESCPAQGLLKSAGEGVLARNRDGD